MTLTEQLLTIADLYSRATGAALSTVSTKAANDGGLFKRLRLGGSITVHRWEQLMQWFSVHWPSDVPLPTELSRYASMPNANSVGCDGDHS